MKWISILLVLLFSFTVLISCDDTNTCARKAIKIGIDIELCLTAYNRMLIKNKFQKFSIGQINSKTKRPVDCSWEVSVLTDKINDLEATLSICEGTDKGRDDPIPVKCNCLDPTEGWME